MKKTIVLCLSLIAVAVLSGCCLQHEWVDATCTEPKTCSKCGKTEGEPLGHDWADATCTEPKTCKRCKSTEGEPNGHSYDSEGWITTKEAGPGKKGERVLYCTVCGEELETEEIDALSGQTIKTFLDYFNQCLLVINNKNDVDIPYLEFEDMDFSGEFHLSSGALLDITTTPSGEERTEDSIIYATALYANDFREVDVQTFIYEVICLINSRCPNISEKKANQVYETLFKLEGEEKDIICDDITFSFIYPIQEYPTLGLTAKNNDFSED